MKRYGSSVRASSLSEVNLQGTKAVIKFTAKYSAPVQGVRWISKLTAGYAGGTGGSTRVSLRSDVELASGFLNQPVQNNPGVVLLFPFIPLTSPTLLEGREYELEFANVDPSPSTNWNSLDGAFVINPDPQDLPDYRMFLSDSVGEAVLDGNNLPLIEIVYTNGRSQGVGYIDVLISKQQPLSAFVAERFIPAYPRTFVGGAIALSGLTASGSIQLAQGSWPPIGQQIIENVVLPPPAVPGGWSKFYFSQPRTVDNTRVWWLIPGGTAFAVPVQKGKNPGGFGPDCIFQDGYAAVQGQPLLSVGGVQTDLQFYLEEK